MKTSLSVTRKKAVDLLVLYTFAYYLLLLVFKNDRIVISDSFSILGEVASLFFIGMSFQWQKNENKIVWKIFFAGTVSYLIGDMIWSYFELVLHQEVPILSICDLFYMVSSIFYFIGMIVYIRKESLFNLIRTAFDALITMTVSLTLIWKFFLIPIAADSSLTFWEKAVSLSYPIFDIGYLGAVLSLFLLFTPKSTNKKSHLLLSMAFLVWFVADQIYLVLQNYTYISGGFIDPLWPIGCWTFALVAVYSESSESNEETKQSSLARQHLLLKEYFRFLLPYLTTCLLIIIVLGQYILEDPLIAGTVISIMLIMIRQIFSLFENQHLISVIQRTNQSLEASKQKLEVQNNELKRLNDLKEWEANTDFLTGLYNRRYINDRLKNLLLEESKSDEVEVSFLIIDIDHFKHINDQEGHKTGDIVLQKVAILIRECIRSTDIAGRYGGDEFIIILPYTDLALAQTIADRLIRTAPMIHFNENGICSKLTLSIGCTQWKGLMTDFDMNHVLSTADRSLYKAKKAGRNQFIAE
ncbi:GGDEF domain-containing protein [Clostridium aminobutyricum]|uniref:GGDEF domain-containing protein n=1 Tax=Clostridium aminobutyricum TaxID=33953 RepID=A0A939DAQ5_CLOAM|nr:GGDEF domain-containing protein [Clostridium aminobutyricum]MBN7774276.1 GGDEF domain-containing protein [Clostridium aminobutyricum]